METKVLFNIKVEISFRSNFGFIPKRTVDAAVNKLKKKDPRTREMFDRGNLNGQAKIVYLDTCLTSVEIRSILNKFIQKYDNLYFSVTVK